MKPVLILQHLHNDGPAYFQTWLRRQGVPSQLRNAEAGDAYPADMAEYSSLAILGGEWSANDERPSLRQAERLILCAMQQGKPVIGHCLGGQLLAKALGATVHASPKPEIGWHEVHMEPTPQAVHWLGARPVATVFQWHFEAFSLPPGAQCLASSHACQNQAVALGPHLALQFHLELDMAKLKAWASADAAVLAECVAHHPDAVQAPQVLLRGAAQHMAAMHRLADTVYLRWLGGLT